MPSHQCSGSGISRAVSDPYHGILAKAQYADPFPKSIQTMGNRAKSCYSHSAIYQTQQTNTPLPTKGTNVTNQTNAVTYTDMLPFAATSISANTFLHPNRVANALRTDPQLQNSPYVGRVTQITAGNMMSATGLSRSATPLQRSASRQHAMPWHVLQNDLDAQQNHYENTDQHNNAPKVPLLNMPSPIAPPPNTPYDAVPCYIAPALQDPAADPKVSCSANHTEATIPIAQTDTQASFQCDQTTAIENPQIQNEMPMPLSDQQNMPTTHLPSPAATNAIPSIEACQGNQFDNAKQPNACKAPKALSVSPYMPELEGPEEPDPAIEGLLHFKKWWYLRKVDVSVNGEMLTGIPIQIRKNALRVINDDDSYFIPMRNVDYIRTPDGLDIACEPCKQKPRHNGRQD